MSKIQLRTALIAIALLLIWWQASDWYQDQLIAEERGHIAVHLDSQGNSLEIAISQRLELLESMDAFVQTEIGSSNPNFGEEVNNYLAQIYLDAIGIDNLAIAPEGIFRYVYPKSESESMIGKSLFLNISPAFREDLQKAIDTRSLVITNPHEMKKGGLGMVARKAIYENGKLWGIISITIDVPTMLQASGLDNATGSLDFALRDDSGHVFYGENSVFQSLPVIHRIELSDGYWELAGMPAGGWTQSVQVPLRIGQMAGLLILGLLTGLYYLVASRQDFLNRMVLEKTADLNNELLERKKAEGALHERDRHLKAIFEAAKNVSFIIASAKSREPVILEFSPGAEKCFGYSREEVLGKTVTMLLVPEDRDKLAEAASRMRKETTLSGYRQLMRRGADTFPAMYSIYPLLDESGEIYAALGVCIDITEQKMMEDELVRARDAAEASARAKSEFTASVSHEIRTPLNAIIGMTDLLLESDLDQVESDYVKTIRISGLSLLSIINEILDFSKIDAGRMDIVQLPFELQEVLETTLDQVAAKAAEKRLELAYVLADDVPGKMMGDSLRLGQVLANLLSNAVKFTQSGEITVSAARDRKNEEFHFTVTDTGIGIPEDRMSRLFLPFSQVDSSLSRRYDGTGLGLAISSRLVELMGGRIWAESKPGVGSQFHFTIPERWGAEAARTDGAARAESAPGAPVAQGSTGAHDAQLSVEYTGLKGKKALVAMEKEASRQMLSNHLRSFAASAQGAGLDREACRLLDQGRYDVIIIDADMAEWPMLAERIGGQQMQQSMPVIEIGFLGEKATLPANRSRIFLAKPVRKAQLAGALMLIFGERNEAAEPEREKALPPAANQDLRILLAEDNPINQKVALAMLKHLGYRADVAVNGKDLLKCLERKSFDVILMDIQMPEMDGLQATRSIRRSLPAAKQPRIIAMTAYTLRGDRERCLAAGMNAYISKPVKMEELKAALEKVRKKED
ncbi:MAG: ATP-binding protein [Methanothrix sp.]|nr:ATP-binding protein [Methanothrix sp.]